MAVPRAVYAVVGTTNRLFVCELHGMEGQPVQFANEPVVHLVGARSAFSCIRSSVAVSPTANPARYRHFSKAEQKLRRAAAVSPQHGLSKGAFMKYVILACAAVLAFVGCETDDDSRGGVRDTRGTTTGSAIYNENGTSTDVGNQTDSRSDPYSGSVEGSTSDRTSSPGSDR